MNKLTIRTDTNNNKSKTRIKDILSMDRVKVGSSIPFSNNSIRTR